MTSRRRRLALALACAPLALGVLAGCGDDDDSGSGNGGGGDLSGNILIDGSSTVAPLSSAAAEAFNEENAGVNIDVRQSGTGGGFEVFCKGESQISNASREIKDDEAQACRQGGVQYTEFRIASDGITLVTPKDAPIGECRLTLDQLKAIWQPNSRINNWEQIPGGNYSSVPMALAGAGSQSGTYDFFNEEVLGKDASGEVLQPRQDYAASEDDNNTVRAVTGSPGGLGYFGFSYFEENQETLQACTLDGVAPSAEAITDGSYPLSRPLYIYVNNEALQRPEVSGFVRYYLENSTRLAEEQQFVPAPQDSLDEDLQELEQALAGGDGTTTGAGTEGTTTS
ncbi:MAG TPA: PstS family phosphate ABC transporter substrate-binding protein [Miltoncostaeaceae bacterium]|nr:PstS family phosphate ABC transporter substrate-binding protein [Miltoncostaeaceae bacterium]